MEELSRETVFRYVEQLKEAEGEGLLARNYRGGKRATLSSRLEQQLVEKLQAGELLRAKEAQAWVKKERGIKLALHTMYYWLGKVEGILKVPRKRKPSEEKQQIATDRKSPKEG